MKFLQLASGVLLVLFLAFGVLATDDYGKCRPGLPRGTRVSVLLEHNKIATFEVGAKHPPRLREIDGLHGTLLGIDVRPRNQTLWGVTDQGGVYQISLAKSEATLKSHLVSATSGNPLLLVNSTNIGVDFNPVVDRLRVVAEFRNWRVDVDTGITQIDGRIHFAENDKLANTTALLNGIAYTNNFAGTNSTTLYGINVRSTKKSHSSKYTLVIINPPNNGTLTSVGSLEIRGGRFGGFDIWTSRWQDTTCNTALFATDGNFYFVDLRSGKATPVWYDLSGWFYRNCRGLSILGIAIWPTKLV